MEPTLHVAADMELPLDLITESNGILGKKGSGKTSAGVVLYEEMYAAGVPVVAVDPKGDWYGIRSSADGKHDGLPVPVFGGRHGDIPLEPTAGAFMADLILARRLSCVLDVSEFTKADLRRFMIAFADRLYRAADRDPMHLLLEECHEYIPQVVSGEDAKMVGAWEKLVKQGRFKGIGVTLLSQRAASVNKNVLTQIDNLFVMRTVSVQDRAAVKGWIEYQADSSDILSTLAGLQSGECWLYQPARDQPIRFRFRMRHTFDAGATPKVGQKQLIPTTLADVDLTAISAAMSETIEKAKADDPKALKLEIAALTKKLSQRPVEAKPIENTVTVEVPIITDAAMDAVRAEIAAADAVIAHLDQVRTSLAESVESLRLVVAPARAVPLPARPQRAPEQAPRREIAPRHTAPAERNEGDVHLRTGARRMVESLGRMAPLRLTKAQWGTVAKLKTTGGTWTAYFGDIKRAGFIDENSAGFTLTAAGFEYLGGAPEPMTPEELQDHYRSILRTGAAKMLDSIMDAYPNSITREEVGEAAGIVITGGTFTAYLGDIVRNGLAVREGNEIRATEILMHGAAA